MTATRTIHRTFCSWTERQERMTPAHPIPLCVAPNSSAPGYNLWYEIAEPDDPKAPPTHQLLITTLGTGHIIPDDAGDYLGTVILAGGEVWHIYARVEALTAGDVQ